ncbi:MAG: leucyl/phenylalanyl-tRNA--protein transferase [Lentisphaeria bacterium]|nr:leucyl/phenylalanyl-tRNA--protein transferase [Lentisphaeria bacterium]
MPVFLLGPEIVFPPVESGREDGLLAVGGDLSAPRLELAYKSGIFPWYSEGEPVLWWSPDPRFVLRPEHVHTSKAMRRVLRSDRFIVTSNQAFEQVVLACADMPRPGQAGTWITPEMRDAYLQLHERGLAHSVETWHDGELVGGLYGVASGTCFCGESMFSKKPDASKAALLTLCPELLARGFDLIDCQVHTPHLESLGAEFMPRAKFLRHLHNGDAPSFPTMMPH